MYLRKSAKYRFECENNVTRRKVIKTHHCAELTLPPPPPPDVTVVPLPTNISQQCTANAVMLPDIAAQAPNVMNTTNR